MSGDRSADARPPATLNGRSDPRKRLARRVGEGVWEWGLELDLPRQVRRARGVVSGRGTEDELCDAVAGRRILVTGASSGIGRECARRLSLAGAEVLIVARREERLRELAEAVSAQGGVAPVAIACDLSDLDAVDALAERVIAEYGGVDVLVNNAGRSIRRPILEAAERLHDFERVMRLNYFAVLHLTLPLIRQMEAQGRGQVVNVSTLGTQFGPQPRYAAYLASKGALDALARSAAPETRRKGVAWTTVHMPLVRTEMIAPTKAYRSAPAMSVEAAAGMVLDGIVRRPARVSHPYGVAFQLVDIVAPRVLEGLTGHPRAQT